MPKGDILGHFEQIVLIAVMRLGDESYGITIRREIEKRTGRSVSLGAVYATLDRLEGKGYVSSRLGEATAERGGKPKMHFKIEAPGQLALRESLRAIGKMVGGVDKLEPLLGVR